MPLSQYFCLPISFCTFYIALCFSVSYLVILFTYALLLLSMSLLLFLTSTRLLFIYSLLAFLPVFHSDRICGGEFSYVLCHPHFSTSYQRNLESPPCMGDFPGCLRHDFHIQTLRSPSSLNLLESLSWCPFALHHHPLLPCSASG